MCLFRLFQSLEDCVGDLPDPRVVGRCDPLPVDILMVAVGGVLGGAENWSEGEEFGKSKEGWLKQYVELPGGMPSHDTVARVFRLLEAPAFHERFMRWVEEPSTSSAGQSVRSMAKRHAGAAIAILARKPFTW